MDNKSKKNTARTYDEFRQKALSGIFNEKVLPNLESALTSAILLNQERAHIEVNINLRGYLKVNDNDSAFTDLKRKVKEQYPFVKEITFREKTMFFKLDKEYTEEKLTDNNRPGKINIDRSLKSSK